MQQAFNADESADSGEDCELDNGYGLFRSKRRRKKLGELSAAEVTSVAHSEIVGIMDRGSNAHKHHITTALVGRIVRAAKKDRLFLQRRFDKETERSSLVGAVRELYSSWDEAALGMLTAARMKEQLRAQRDMDASTPAIRLVLR